ncbi:MAG: uracil-DNA glycosylase [Chitinophagaceae bacterium]|nr:uracil-DNA glycosylase [Chitinophagaceae bacterium]
MFLINEPSWKAILSSEFEKTYFKNIYTFLETEKTNQKNIFPAQEHIFNAFEYCSFDKTSVLILGQDPYHNFGQANGLSFSVPKNITIPPSLKNIFNEIKMDLNIENTSGDLSNWAEQGVLLLNATLTVEANKPNSHSKIGWQHFTDEIINILNEKKENFVFILWGNFAIEKSKFINEKKHLILSSPHPSPFSAYKGFLGNQHFSKCNDYLIKNGKSKIDWNTF